MSRLIDINKNCIIALLYVSFITLAIIYMKNYKLLNNNDYIKKSLFLNKGFIAC